MSNGIECVIFRGPDNQDGPLHFGTEEGAFCGKKGLERLRSAYFDLSGMYVFSKSGIECTECVQQMVYRLQAAFMPEESNEELLGFRTIAWNSIRKQFHSPLYTDFIWPESGYVEAGCRYKLKWPENYDLSSHIPGSAGCHCGIYALANVEVAAKYHMGRSTSVIVVVKAMGETDIWSQGFRTEAAQVVAVTFFSGYRAAKDFLVRMERSAHIASTYFGVPKISDGEAVQLVLNSWLANGFVKDWEGEWTTLERSW